MGSTVAIKAAPGDVQAAAVAGPSAIVSVMDAHHNSLNNGREHSVARLTRLLLAVASKDQKAFEAFYDATVERALSLALRITQQVETAEEVVSDVYMQVWRQAAGFDPARGNALAWLTVLCRSRALDTLRKNTITPTHGAAPASGVPELEDARYPQDLLVATEENSALHAALALLEPGQRQLLALAYFRGYTHSELATITGLPLGTVKTQLRRSLGKMKKLMVDGETEHREYA